MATIVYRVSVQHFDGTKAQETTTDQQKLAELVDAALDHPGVETVIVNKVVVR